MFSDEFNFPKKDVEIEQTSWNAASQLPASEIYFWIFSDEFNFLKKDAVIDQAGWNTANCFPPIKFISECFQTS